MKPSARQIFIFISLFLCHESFSQHQKQILLIKADTKTLSPHAVTSAHPLDALSIVNAEGKTITVADGDGDIYFSSPAQKIVTFYVAGALGRHTINISNKKGMTTSTFPFDVDTATDIDDGGHYKEMFDLFYTSMQTDTGSVVWHGSRYRYFVPWGLDHCHTMKGLKYFYGFGEEFVDLMRQAQRDDGMIWSFVEHMPIDYWRTRDAKTGYTQKVGDKYFVRQPTENHPEYIFVKTIYQCWKASGDDAWMQKNLEAAARALDYCMTDPARWSNRFGLLKRVYTIDSWDFQVDDEYLPDLGITNTMIIDPEKSKFGVFFGDNTAYAEACNQLAEMHSRTGEHDQAKKFSQRANEINTRLDALSWNGKFYTHFIDEDSTVKRKLGVDEKTQLAQSNAYSINRGITHDKSKAIIESYLNLRSHLPVGSPGEWYAIYPPFEHGFEMHGAKWQYMNGGVGGHVAGELARGAFENGYEKYGVDILERMFDLGKKYDNKIYFSYTGSILPPPPTPTFTPVNISNQANMDSWITGGKNSLPWMNSTRPGDDLRNLPLGEQTFANIRFNVLDPKQNDRRCVVAVSNQKGFPSQVDIPINKKAGAIYMLHTSSKPSSENVSGVVSFLYDDNSIVTRYMMMGKHLAYWWFSQLKTDHSGIAWYGSNDVSKGIGISWCAIDNPHPERTIAKIILHAAADETIYTVLGISLSDQKHYVPVNPVSYGGPDNWAAATNMAALIEGLAGVKDSPGSEKYEQPTISPRWSETNADTLNVTIRYAASKGYISYVYINQSDQNQIQLLSTGSGKKINYHILVPKNKSVTSVMVNGKTHSFTSSSIEQSNYVDFSIEQKEMNNINVHY